MSADRPRMASHTVAENSSRSLLVGAIPRMDEDSAQVHTDIYGRKPPDVVRREERMTALEREIHRLPSKQRTALDKVRRMNSVAYEASSHTRLLIETEPFDPTDAALRLARYWERRSDLFGDRAFSEDTFSQPDYADYTNYYRKCTRVLDDPDADDDTKELSRVFVDCVQRVKVKSLDRVVDGAADGDKKALVEAQSRGAGNTKEHKLLFLEREDFIETRAAERMMKYWEMKLSLFGPNKFHQDITFRDIEFGEEEKCFARLMPGTDEHQRTLVAIFVNALEEDGWTVENVGRFYWCIIHAALERQSCRDNGLVIMLNYKSGSKHLSERIGPVRHFCRSMLFDCIPVKLRASHVFFESSSWWQWLFASIFATVGSAVQKRAMIHVGTDYENRRELKERFGIPPENVPQEIGGDFLFESWESWLEERAVK